MVAFLSGCGHKYATGEGVRIKGQILKGGAPLRVSEKEKGTGWIEVTLFAADPAQGTQLADTSTQSQDDGSFFMDYEGRGVPPGKYKLAVYQRNEGPGTDQLNGKFSKENTTIIVDAESSKVGGTLDLGTIELDKAGK